MNTYNFIVKAPTVIQPLPHGQPEVVTFDSPPVVEYANHFRAIEDLEEYLESLKYVPIQRPADNFVFTESADNFVDYSDHCMHCLRFYPTRMTPLDRGRHSAKICPYRPVKCGVCSAGMTAKDYLYLHLWVCDPELDMEDRRAGVWMWSNAAKRDRMLRREAEERALHAESIARRTAVDLDETERYASQALAMAESQLMQARAHSGFSTPGPGGPPMGGSFMAYGGSGGPQGGPSPGPPGMGQSVIGGPMNASPHAGDWGAVRMAEERAMAAEMDAQHLRQQAAELQRQIDEQRAQMEQERRSFRRQLTDMERK